MFFFLKNFLEEESPSKRRKIDYEFLFQKIKQEGPLSTAEIQRLTGTSRSGVQNVITILSIDYPIWQPARGMYAAL